MRRLPFVFLVLVALVLPSAHSAATGQSARYLVVFEAKSLDSSTASGLIHTHGGTMVEELLDIGVAVATSSDPSFSKGLETESAVLGVTPEVPRTAYEMSVDRPPELESLRSPGSLQTLTGRSAAILSPMAAATANATLVTADDLLNAPFFAFGYQWDLQKIQADAAWQAGALGDPAVKVAIVSSGIDYTHPDLAGKVDLALSKSFVPSDDLLVEQLFPGAHPIADLGIHGSYVASIIACNAVGQACGAPNVTLIGVKVLNFEETGTIATLAQGVRYAANVGADIIALPDNFGFVDVREPDGFLETVTILRAVLYARLRGALVIGGAWATVQAELGKDLDRTPFEFLLPAEAGTTVISATGTEDQWSGITSYGRTLIDVSAPGGQVDPETVMPPPDIFIFSVGVCSSFTQETRFGLPETCNKDNPPQYFFSFGARAAVAHAVSVAALIESRWGGAKRGSFVRQKLLHTADDILAPGFDEKSGHGRVNALRAHTE